MLRLLVALLAAASVAGCGSLTASPSPSLASALPNVIGGQAVVYTERTASDLGGNLIYFQKPIETVGGSLETARVAVGLGRDGLTLTALRVPDSHGVDLIDPLITAANFNATARTSSVVGGKNAVVLTLPPTTRDRAYVYAWADTVVVLTTSDPALADETLRSLP